MLNKWNSYPTINGLTNLALGLILLSFSINKFAINKMNGISYISLTLAAIIIFMGIYKLLTNKFILVHDKITGYMCLFVGMCFSLAICLGFYDNSMNLISFLIGISGCLIFLFSGILTFKKSNV